jgi:hypothetical protein
MPTGKDQQNPKGLMKAAKALLKVQTQLQSFVETLSSSKELATQFDDAVMRKDRKAIQNLLREQGIKGEITIDKIQPDRMIVFAVCAGWTYDYMRCYQLTLEW